VNQLLGNAPAKTDNVVVVIVHDGDDHLIVVRDLTSRFPTKWEFPGGRILEGETREQAAVRIVKKELGVLVAASAVGQPIARIKRGGRPVTSVRVNLPEGPRGNIPVCNEDRSHEIIIISKRDLVDYMPRKSDRVLLVNGYKE
jgi:hypothetical protein